MHSNMYNHEKRIQGIKIYKINLLKPPSSIYAATLINNIIKSHALSFLRSLEYDFRGKKARRAQ